MSEDLKILEAVEKYIDGQMSHDERVYFEQLRKSHPEIDQLVVEHSFFLLQMNRYDDVKKFKNVLNDAHNHLSEKGMIRAPRLQGKARVIYLFNRYKRVSAIAASIAGITALAISALVWSISPAKQSTDPNIDKLNRYITTINNKVNQIQQNNRDLANQINSVKDQSSLLPSIKYISGGTGFLIDNKGFIVTNAHVIEGARHIAVQSANGSDLKANVIYLDEKRDLAILKINDTAYKAPSPIPYSIKKTGIEIAEPVFTLGFPRNDIVYGDGYIAAKTGYNGDTLTCQIAVPANRGNSGSPILNRNGEIIGLISNKQNNAEGAVFAIQSKYIYSAIAELQKDSSYAHVHIPSSGLLKNLERTQQVKKMADYVFMVKVD